MKFEGYNLNPSSLLCFPEEQGITVDDYFVYTFETNPFVMGEDLDILYDFNFRKWYQSDDHPSGWHSVIFNDSFQTYYTAKDTKNIDNVSMGSTVMVKASDILSDKTYIGTLNPPYPNNMNWMYDCRLQWRTEYGVKFSNIKNQNSGGTESKYDFLVPEADRIKFKQIQDGSFIYYNSKNASGTITVQAYGYISKMTAYTFRIYRYQEGAITKTLQYPEFCIANTEVNPNIYIKTVNYSNWIDFTMSPKANISFDATRVIDTIDFLFTASCDNKDVLISKFKFFLYDESKNIIFESDYIYKATLEYKYDKIFPNKKYYCRLCAVDINNIKMDTSYVEFSSSDFMGEETGYKVYMDFNCKNDYVRLYSKEDYLSDMSIYKLNITTGEFSYIERISNYNPTVMDFLIADGNSYKYYLIGEYNQTTKKYLYKEFEQINVKYSCIFFDDVENKKSYKINLMLNNGGYSKGYRVSKIDNDLMYPTYSKSLSDYVSGSVGGLLISGVNLSDNEYVKDFREFMSSGRKCYFKDMNGNMFNIIVTDFTTTLINSSIREQALIASITFTQIKEE